MQAGGHYSEFKLVERTRLLCSTSRLPRPRLLIKHLRDWGLCYCIFTVLCLKSEKFWENLKIHAGGNHKLQIQFAPPKQLSVIHCPYFKVTDDSLPHQEIFTSHFYLEKGSSYA